MGTSRVKSCPSCSLCFWIGTTLFYTTLAAQAPAALLECLNAGEHSQQTTYQNFVDGKPTRLTVLDSWWSDKSSPLDLTIVTGLTVSRLDQLEAQCKAWQGPISAAVYLVLPTLLDTGVESTIPTAIAKAVKDMTALHKRLERLGKDSCALNMMLLVETVSERIMKWMLPINVLRNYALLAAETRLVAMVDVDLLPSTGLATWLLHAGNMQWLARECSQHKVFVLPAFETMNLPNMTAAHAISSEAAAADKKGLQKMVEAGKVWQFALKIFREGHNCTDYSRWFTSSAPYGPVGWTKDYEPWFIVDRTLTPFYDSVFRGYGWNKVTQVTNVHHSGFQFMVHPTGFLVHRQHSYSKAGTMYQNSKTTYEKSLKIDKAKAHADKSLAATTHKFRDRVLEQLGQGSYQPVLDEGVNHCLSKLPWWSHSRNNTARLSNHQLAGTTTAEQHHRRRRRQRRRQQLEQPARMPRRLRSGPVTYRP